VAQCGFAARFKTESGLAKNIGRDGLVHIIGRSAHRYGNAKGGAHSLESWEKNRIPKCLRSQGAFAASSVCDRIAFA
jgi:hypothetical protein